MELLRIGIILVFGELVQLIRYFVWSVLERNFMVGLIVVRKRLGGNILNEDICKELT
jgi:hypothetical protein